MNTTRCFYLLMILAAFALAGCEGDAGPDGPVGPVGPAGADGADGDDVSSTSLNVCLECHTNGQPDADFDFLQLEFEYTQSGHFAGDYVGYAGGRASCAHCHGKQGFIQYAVNGEVTGDIVDPVAIDCSTCHSVHPDEFALRLDGPVAMVFDETYELDFGDASNLCANCHQSRRAEPNIAEPGETFEITSTHYGPHHGPQANVLEGVGFAEIEGSVDYPTSSGHLDASQTCVTCHMAEYVADDPETDDVDEAAGGHSWRVTYDCAPCHTQDAIDTAQAAIGVKLDALRDRLVELEVVEYDAEHDSYHPIVGTYPMVQAQGFFNWIGLAEDRSLGAHNPSYVEALIDNTMEALAD